MTITPRKVVLLLLLAGIAALTLYSLHVAYYRPDGQETVLLGQSRLAVDGPAAIRVLVRNSANHQPIAGAGVSVSLANAKGAQFLLGDFKTTADGTVTDSVRMRDIPPSDYTIVVTTRSPLGYDRIERRVKIVNPVRLLLSTDKPIYQPGQIVHLRALITSGAAQKPAKGEAITFEVSDSKGNKVFRESRTSSRFGIVSADFALAQELNLGSYQISALSGDATAEQIVEIKRYTLPKFKVGLATAKSYYLPGEELRGVIDAAYFFGQPVGGAEVKLTAASSGGKPAEIGAAGGVTDADGKFAFSILLPAHIANMPETDQNTSLDLTAEVKDIAGHTERKTIAVLLAAHALQITAFPEQGQFVPRVENQVFVITNTPDGQPAPCEVTANGRVYKTDTQGICALPVMPVLVGSTLAISARDARGYTADVTLKLDDRKNAPTATTVSWANAMNVTLSPDEGEPNAALLLRPDKASYHPGAKVRLAVSSFLKTATVFVDVMRDSQTVLARSTPLKGNQGELVFDLPPDLTGLLRICAYTIDGEGRQVGGSRLIYVNPADNLRVAATRDREVYRPGETAKLAFQVTYQNGRPAPSALGIKIVDESVSALSDSLPEFSRQSFNAGQQTLSPRFTLGLFSSPMRLLQNSESHPLAAQAYLSNLDRQTDGLSLDSLAGDYLNSSFIEHLRSMQGTPALEHFRSDPQYAEAFRILENSHADYSLSADTGARKKQDAEMRRRKYFDALGSFLGFLLVSALIVSPLALIIYTTRAAAPSDKMAFTPEIQALIDHASRQHRLLSLLTMFPYVYYILTGFVSETLRARNGNGFWFGALSVEILISIAIGAFSYRQASRLNTIGLPSESVVLQRNVVLFLLQLLAARFIFCVLALAPYTYTDAAYPLLYLLVMVSPWLALAFTKFRTSEMLLRRGVPKESQPPAGTAFTIAAYVFLLFILAGISLPTFSSVQVKGLQTQALSDLKQFDLARQLAAQDAPQSAQPTSQPRLRKDFPETLLWQPEMITDDEGRATLEAPLADSITTWRASIDAISSSGTMANAELPIRAYQDFFVEIEPPEFLTLGDSISVPAVCHNYLDTPLDVQVTLADGDWFEATPEDRIRTVKLAPHEVRGVEFPITVTRVGVKRLRVTAQAGATGDALEREIRVAPSGRRIDRTENNVLRDTAAVSFDLPSGAIPDASNLTLKIYPSRFSEVVEGLDSIFHAPYGCFEQTSSATYPNVLALDYLKSAGRLTPEMESRARKFISDGYQRLLKFEVPGGGFELFGYSPANVWLTAYGVLEFSDMARVHPVDLRMLQRTSSWLFSKQAPDGSWMGYSSGETWSRLASTTAYVAWALAEFGDKSPQLDKALAWLARNRARLDSTYSKALAANAFLARDREDATGRSLATELAEAAQHPDPGVTCWKSSGQSMYYSRGESLSVETTALAALALMKDGRRPDTVKQALTWISRQKNQEGDWNTTQATILAMRALIAGSRTSLGQTQSSDIDILLNGAEIQRLHITKDNSDIMQLVSLTDRIKPGENRIELRLDPPGELSYQITESYSLPGQTPETGDAAPSLQIDVAYDRTTIAVGDRLKCSVTAQNHTQEDIQMPMVILGIPPGFELDTDAFESLQSSGKIAIYELRGNQVLLYLRQLSPSAPLRFDYLLRAKYPLRVQAPIASLYEYYTPEHRASSRPPKITVSPKP